MSIRNYYKHLNTHRHVLNIIPSLACIWIGLSPSVSPSVRLREAHRKASSKANKIVRNPKYFDILKFNNEERAKLMKSIEVLKKKKKLILPNMKEEIHVWKTRQAKRSSLLKTKSTFKKVKNDRANDNEDKEISVNENKSKITCIPMRKNIVKIGCGSIKVEDHHEGHTEQDPTSILKAKQNKSMMKMLLSQPEKCKKTFQDYVREREIRRKKEKFLNVLKSNVISSESGSNELCDSTLEHVPLESEITVPGDNSAIELSSSTTEKPQPLTGVTTYTCYPSGCLKKPELLTETVEQKGPATEDHLMAYLDAMLKQTNRSDTTQEPVQQSLEQETLPSLTNSDIVTDTKPTEQHEDKLFDSNAGNESENKSKENVGQDENSNLVNEKSHDSMEISDKSMDYFKERYDEKVEDGKIIEEQTAINSSDLQLLQNVSSICQRESSILANGQEAIPKSEQIHSTLLIPYNSFNFLEYNTHSSILGNSNNIQRDSIKTRKVDLNLGKNYLITLYLSLAKNIANSQRSCEKYFKLILFEHIPGMMFAIVKMTIQAKDISVKQVYLAFNKMLDLKTNMAHKSSHYFNTLSATKRKYASDLAAMLRQLTTKQLIISKRNVVVQNSQRAHSSEKTVIPKSNSNRKTLYSTEQKSTKRNDKVCMQSEEMIISLRNLYKQCLNERKHQFPLAMTANMQQLQSNSKLVRDTGQVVAKKCTKTIKVHSDSSKLLRQKSLANGIVTLLPSVPSVDKVKPDKGHPANTTQKKIEAHQVSKNERKPQKSLLMKKKNISKLLNSDKKPISNSEIKPPINIAKRLNVNHPESSWQLKDVKPSSRKYLDYLKKSLDNPT